MVTKVGSEKKSEVILTGDNLNPSVVHDKDELAKKIDKLTICLLMMLNHIREGKEIDNYKVVLTVPKSLAQQIEAILTK